MMFSATKKYFPTALQADTEKGPFRSNCSFSVSACMYVMILNGKLHTSKLQKQVSNRIFHKEEKGVGYMQTNVILNVAS